MAGFLDSTFETSLTSLPNNHGTQTLTFVKNVLRGLKYVSLSVVGRVVTGQVKYGDGTNYAGVFSVNLQCDEVMAVNTGTLVTTGNSSIQINTNSSGVFQVTIAGSQGATVIATAASGVSTLTLVGSGGTGGGGGGGISGITVKDEGSTVTGGPHSTLNFVGSGVSVADAGSGQATVTIASAGGYQGNWSAGTYQAGAIVRRGPFLFGAVTTTSVDPCDVNDCGSASDWTVINVGTNPGTAQGNGVFQLTNAQINMEGVAYRQATMTTWAAKRLIADVLSGPNATGIFIGVYDAALTQGNTSGAARVGQYGVFIDNWNNGSGAAVQSMINGVRGNAVTGMDALQVSGNDNIDSTRFHRYYVDMVESGANMILTLWKENFDTGTLSGINKPGFMATWTFTKPSFTTCRLSAAAYTGGVSGYHRVRNFFALDRSGAWDMLSMYPHAPRMDTSAW